MYANYFGLLIYQRKLCLNSTYLQQWNSVEGQAQNYGYKTNSNRKVLDHMLIIFKKIKLKNCYDGYKDHMLIHRKSFDMMLIRGRLKTKRSLEAL